jgi:hypothetical protein
MTSPETAADPRSGPSVPALIAGWIGLLALLPVGFFYLSSGLVAPLWAMIVLWIIWFALFGLGVYLLSRKPAWILALPVLAFGIWFGALSAGEAWLGWTA